MGAVASAVQVNTHLPAPATTPVTHGESVVRSYKYRDPDKRRAYMREYMKRWRVT